MTRMSDEIRHRIDSCIDGAKDARRNQEWVRCWSLLEDAHVLSQPWVRSHTRVHLAMLVAGWMSRDVTEVRGQLLRLLVSGPASAVGRYPIGNTGRSRVPATLPMPMKPELAALLKRAGEHAG